jgi:putative AbiEi antitoxin of type IV toxin-antitoxin system
MTATQALKVLTDVTATQWGMVTTAQAASLGVSRLSLSRLTEVGHLERLVHGVYRAMGAPADEFETLRAAWLSTQPEEVAEARLTDPLAGVVVTGASAAHLHHIGDLPADRHEFSTSRRRQSQRPDIRYRIRTLPRQDITLAHGLPVTTKERTLADLVETRTDLGLVAAALGDALRSGSLDLSRLELLLAPFAARNGFRTDDGNALLDRLVEMSGALRELSRAIERLTSKTKPSLASVAAIGPDLLTLEALARGGSRD